MFHLRLACWLNRSRPGKPRRGAQRHRLCLEVLEDRTVPSFAAPVSHAAGGAAYDNLPVISADFNSDGNADLGCYTSTGVSVVLGNGNGTFQAPRLSPVGSPSNLVTADFNRDGFVDLANGYLQILLGNGDGTFRAGVDLGGPEGAFAVGDLNGDGKTDLLSTRAECVDEDCFELRTFLTVRLGNGDGTFGAPVDYTGVEGYLVLGDFNEDGKLDVLAGQSLWLGNGDGTLQNPQIVLDGGVYGWAAVADLNGDGHLDVASRNWFIDVFLGNGNGTFQPRRSYDTRGRDAAFVISADINRDGLADLFATNGGSSGGITDFFSVLFGTVAGAPRGPESYSRATEPFRQLGVAAGDFNRDGFPDVAFSNGYTRSFIVYMNRADWVTTPAASINDVTIIEGNSGTSYAQFQVTLSAAASQPVTMQYRTEPYWVTVAAGPGAWVTYTADAGSDYGAASGTLTFAPGETSKTIAVAVYGDGAVERHERFAVRLLDPANAVVTRELGVATIENDDVHLQINDAGSVVEGHTGTRTASLSVVLIGEAAQTVTVDYATANGTATAGSDYQSASGTLTFAPGETSKTVTVNIFGDRLGEANETFFVNLSNASGAIIIDNQGTATIADDEPRISISDVSRNEGAAGTTTLFTFTVTLSVAYDQAVTVSFRTADGTAKASSGDYVARTGTLTFAPGETTKTITIDVKGDNKREGNETFFLDLFGNSSNSLFTKSRGIGTILNDD